jgi:putative repeat organellar protein
LAEKKVHQGGTDMSEKTSAEVIIGGKVYKLSGYEEEGYLQKVAAYINNKINEYDGMEGFRRLPGDMKATLIQLNIADDYFKAKSQAEKLELEIEAKEKEIYNLKHDLISNQIKAESDEKTLKELEAQNKELLLNKARLEASLEEKLLGKLPDEKDSPKEPESEPEEKHEKSKEK